MAKLKKPPIPLKMYQHFAAATVVLTGAIALFADDENRQAMAQHVEERDREAEIQRASQEITGPRELIRRDSTRGGSFGTENFADGAPMDDPQSSGATTGRGGDGARPLRAVPPGYERGFIDSLTDEQYRRLIEALPPEQRGSVPISSSRPITRRERGAIERASLRRSGGSGQSEDAPD